MGFDQVNYPFYLSTGPQEMPTHWKQTVFYLRDPINVTTGSHLDTFPWAPIASLLLLPEVQRLVGEKMPVSVVIKQLVITCIGISNGRLFDYVRD